MSWNLGKYYIINLNLGYSQESYIVNELDKNMERNSGNVKSIPNQVPDVLMLSRSASTNQNVDLQNILKTSFGNFTNTSSNEASNYINNNCNQPKFAEVQSDSTECFEVANKLKHYATVNTAEPIPIQLSYNIGTENIEDGKEGETLENTEVGLEENSIITEIENAGIDLYDIDLNDGVNAQNLQSNDVNNFEINGIFNDEQQDKLLSALSSEPKRNFTNSNPNVNIISVENILPPSSSIVSKNETEMQGIQSDLVNLHKQIYTPEALEMSLACEEEAPSTWIDVMRLVNSNPLSSFEHSSVDDNNLTAVLTGIQSYTDVEVPQPNVVSDSFATANDQARSIQKYFYVENLNNSAEEIFFPTSNDNAIIENCVSVNSNNHNTLNSETNVSYTNLNTSRSTIVTGNSNENILKNITADADICRCIDCKCGPNGNCQDGRTSDSFMNSQKKGCCTTNKMSNSNSSKESSHSVFAENLNICSNNVQYLSTTDQPKSNVAINESNCTKEGSNCCVLVCLKSLDQLKHLLTFANCSNFQKLSFGCVSNDICAIKK